MIKKGKFNVFTSEKERVLFGKMSRKEKWAIAGLILVLLVLGVFFFFKWMANRSAQETGLPSSTVPLQSETTSTPQTANMPGVDPASLFGSANYWSENFRVGDIAIGGEAEFLLTEDTPEPLAISSIRGETFTEKNSQEVRLVLSFKTNKLAKSVVTYSKGPGQASKTVSEDDYSLGHSLIITGLEQSSSYIYAIVSADRFGNVATSDQHAIYTGSKTASLFDLIANAIGEVFGWAIKK